MNFLPRLLLCCATTLLAAAIFCSGCTGLNTPSASTASASAATKKDAVLVKSPMDLSFLLSMSFTEAKTLSTQQLEFPPHLKIAADSIQVFKYAPDGRPLKARARGKVFIEMNFDEPAKALCQEAFITENEVILRGSPILQRGGSMVEGLDESTIFYLFGSSLRVIGLHKVNNQNQIAAMMPTLGSWAGGPNPLLPPLTEGDVPVNIRSEMQRAAEAEMLHQKTRELYGPAPAPDAAPTPPKPDKAADQPKPAPSANTAKKNLPVEIRKALPNKKSFWSRTDKTRA